jgi:hypothetical protein
VSPWFRQIWCLLLEREGVGPAARPTEMELGGLWGPDRGCPCRRPSLHRCLRARGRAHPYRLGVECARRCVRLLRTRVFVCILVGVCVCVCVLRVRLPSLSCLHKLLLVPSPDEPRPTEWGWGLKEC